jgi:hypothetical protein
VQAEVERLAAEAGVPVEPLYDQAALDAEREKWRGIVARAAADANRYGLEGLVMRCSASETGQMLSWEVLGPNVASKRLDPVLRGKSA